MSTEREPISGGDIRRLEQAVDPMASSGHAREQLERNDTVLKVSSTSRPTAVAGAIANIMRAKTTVEIQAIGAGAVNQTVKSIAIARSYLSEEAIELICTPSFTDVSIDGQERTAIRLVVERRAPNQTTDHN